MKSEKKSAPVWRRILKTAGIIVLIIIAAVAALVIWLTLTEYRPDDVEALEVLSTPETETPVSGTEEIIDAAQTAGEKSGNHPGSGSSLKVMTWNTGYGCLGDNADFFMDGGSGVKTADKKRLSRNLEGISSVIKEEDPDILFLQEVDSDSDRSSHVDETMEYASALEERWYTYALNYNVNFIPYPVPPIGKVTSGIETFSKYEIAGASRYQLPCPFSWPVRLGNLKRCLAVHEIPLDGTDRKLIAVNLHLEAYDDGEGKKAQTQVLREVLEREAAEGNYVIAGGDFNQIFSDYEDESYTAYPVYKGKWQPAVLDCSEFDSSQWQFEMDTSVPSCRSLDQPYEGADTSSFQYYMIDGFIVSSNITVNSVETLDCGFRCSDHNPVVMEMTLK